MTVGAIALSLLLLGAQVGGADQRTGTLVPNANPGTMVEEAGRVRSSERNTPANAAAIRRAADQAHETMRKYASCLVFEANSSRERTRLIEFLSVSPEGADADARLQRTIKPDCLYNVSADSVLLRFSAPLLRGEVFRELYLDLAANPRRAPITRAQIADAWSTDNFRGNFAGTQHFADCVIAADPAAADALMRVKVGSAEQTAAVNRVAAHMGPCLTNGATLQMSRIVLEGAVAEALYRRATDPTANTAAPTRPGTN